MTESQQSVSAKQVRDVVALGKKASKTAFPNPSREGCPNSSTLRAMAYRDRQLTLKDLPISHVVTCSPCFQEYARLRRISVLLRGIQVTAASLVVLAVLFAAGRFVRNYTRGRGEPSISQERRAGPQQPRAATPQTPAPTAPLAMTVDLASFSPTRGEESKGSLNKVHFPPKLLRVTFLLPVGMEPGEYSLRLRDSAGIVLKDTRLLGQLKNGVTSVEADLDFSASRGSFSLMIRPPGLSWRTYPVLVE